LDKPFHLSDLFDQKSQRHFHHRAIQRRPPQATWHHHSPISRSNPPESAPSDRSTRSGSDNM